MKEVYSNAPLSDSRQAFLDGIWDGDPQTFVIYHDKITSYADKAFALPPEEYTPTFANFTQIPQEMQDWVEQELPSRDRPKTLVVWGPSRTGKTSWARSLVSGLRLFIDLSHTLIGITLLHEHLLEGRQGRHKKGIYQIR